LRRRIQRKIQARPLTAPLTCAKVAAMNELATPKTGQAEWNQRHREGAARRLDQLMSEFRDLRADVRLVLAEREGNEPQQGARR
jgi:hypothetical protein